MIIRRIFVESKCLRYYVGIGGYAISYSDYLNSNNLTNHDDKTILDHFFSQLESIENHFKGSTIQMFKDDYLINREHLFLACYHVQKAFSNKTNIVNRKNLELLLYLSADRQIKNAINAFGIDVKDLKTNNLNYCIMSTQDNLHEISRAILKKINGTELNSEFNFEDINKYNMIKEFFQVRDAQVNVLMNSYDELHDFDNIDLRYKFNALYELVCEKMVLLSLEKIKLDHL